MAIKVGGTTVIDDSRQLSNIASVDATTVAALGAAGVGGGGGVVSLQASGGNISQGDIVSLNSDGTITAIDVAGGDFGIGSTVATNIPLNTVYRMHATFYDTTNDILIMAYRNVNGYASLIAGKVQNGQVTSWGSQLEVYTSDPTDAGNTNGNIIYDPTKSQYVLGFTRNGSAYVHLCGFTVNTTTLAITKNNETEIRYANSAIGFKILRNAAQNRFVYAYLRGGNDYIDLGDFDYNANSTSFYSNQGEQQIASNGIGFFTAYPSEADDCIIMAYNLNYNSSELYLRAVKPNSSNGVDLGTQTSDLHTPNTNIGSNFLRIAYNSNDDEYILLYSSVNTYNVYVITFTYNSSTDTFTTSSPITLVNDDRFNSADRVDLAFNSSDGYYYFTVDEGVNTGGTFNTQMPGAGIGVFRFQASASSGTVSNFSFVAKVYDTDGQTKLFYNTDLGVFGYNEDTYSDPELFSIAETRVPSWVGIAKENITSGSSVEVYVLSGVSPDQTGLTPRSTYYIDTTTNALTTTATDYKIGKALTSTKLLITEGNA